jgi:MFS transporter, NNP family, nitrate/nitrite transporter
VRHVTDVLVPPTTTSLRPATATRSKRWIDDWRPEDEAFWQSTGAPIAKRNLVFSILSEHIGFCIWSMWSALVLFLGPEYGLDPGKKFLLTTLPTAVGATLRIPYTLAVAKFGGRNWTIVSALLLLIPTTFCAVILEPGVSFGTLLVAATLAGVGGGNFSSSMANIDAFYPTRLKGWALGLNAGGGNLGVAVVQLVGLAVLAIAGKEHPRILVLCFVPLVVASTVCAWRYMDNLTVATNDERAMRDVIREPHTWGMCFLYIGTFGSFVGFSFAFGQVLQVQFADTFSTPVKAAYLTFLGPLIGSLMRPVGGRVADRVGAARVTFWTFVAMVAGAVVVIVASVTETLGLFLFGFLVLFVLSGVGNGSIYKMIPSVFLAKAEREIAAGADAAAAVRSAKRLTRSLIGLAGAIGAFGGVAVNLALRQSFLSAKTGTTAYVGFVVFYALCLTVTWTVYVRPAQRRAAGS